MSKSGFNNEYKLFAFATAHCTIHFHDANIYVHFMTMYLAIERITNKSFLTLVTSSSSSSPSSSSKKTTKNVCINLGILHFNQCRRRGIILKGIVEDHHKVHESE